MSGALIGLLLVLSAAPARAHDVGLARVEVDAAAGEAVRLTLDGRIADLTQLLELPEGIPIPPRVFERALPGAIDRWVAVAADGAHCPLTLDHWGRLDALALRLELTARCPKPPVDLTIAWPAAGDPLLRWSALVVVTTADGMQPPEVLAGDRRALTIRAGQEPPPVSQTVWRFGFLGVEHIVLGWDHLAFVLALMLGCGRLRRLLIVVTGFTVAHSVTLALGATGVIELSPALVEPIIALSIAVAAAMSLARLRRGTLDHPGRAADRGDTRSLLVVCLAFGLVHGFGFAGLLADLLPPGGDRLWPLLGFNVGVELGQLACVLVAWPLLRRIGQSRAARPVFGGLLAVLIALGLVITALRLIG